MIPRKMTDSEAWADAMSRRGLDTSHTEPLPPLPPGAAARVEINLVVVAETGKALRVARAHDTHGGEVWVPRSQVNRVINLGLCSVRRGGIFRKVEIVTMPAWLYNEKRGLL